MELRRSYFTALFFVKRSKLLKNGEAPICLRITIDGQRDEMQIRRSVDLALWDSAKERSKGKDYKAIELNRYIDTLRSDLQHIHSEMVREGEIINPRILKLRLSGAEAANQLTLCQFFAKYNERVRALMDIDYVKGTVLRHERTERNLKAYIRQQYKVEDIALKKVDRDFIIGFEFFLKADKERVQNTAVSYMKCFKKVMGEAVANKHIDTNPFAGIHLRQTKTNRVFLTEKEVNILIEKEFAVDRLNVIRDLFVFSCFTGLAFTDVEHLRSKHITQDDKGEFWIHKPREKTDNMCSIPLLKIPHEILERYKDHPKCRKSGMLLPLLSNQRMNSYLKEIGDACGIEKSLSTHIARHSFACIALANGVSMASIARMLGHSDIRTTQIYAKLMDDTVSKEMSKMKSKY